MWAKGVACREDGETAEMMMTVMELHFQEVLSKPHRRDEEGDFLSLFAPAPPSQFGREPNGSLLLPFSLYIVLRVV